MIFKGSGVAIVTPFTEDNKVDYIKLEELINFHIENKSDAIIVCGTTGESSTLSMEEKKQIIRFSVSTSKNKIPIIAGTGSNNTLQSVELSKFAMESGCDGLLVVTPYYNKCNQDGLYIHYKEIALSVNIPIILYNVPSRTGVNISIDNLIRLSKIPNICAIKEASPDISRIALIISKMPDGFGVYSGNDDLTLPILALGGMGVISVAANIIPKHMHDICEYFFAGEIEKSKKTYYKNLELINSMFLDVNPICIKEAMNILGFGVGNCRLPLSRTSDSNINIITNILKECTDIPTL